MGIAFDDLNKTYKVSYYKRHPKTGIPVRAARKGIQSKAEAEANRVYAELVVQVENKLHEQVVPKWADLVEQYRRACLEKGMTSKTVENYHICLKAHTVEAGGERCVDAITTEEIRALLQARVGDKAPTHQKNVIKTLQLGMVSARRDGPLHWDAKRRAVRTHLGQGES